MTPRPRLADYLPAALREDQALLDLLLAFEAVLLQSADSQSLSPEGLERIVDDIPRRLCAGDSAVDGAPDEFLLWLGQWLALSLRTDIYDGDSAKNNALLRRFIGGIGAIYPYRGTKGSLRELLGLFTERDPATIQVTESKDRPHHFSVTLDLTDQMRDRGQAEIERLREVAEAVIRQEKPAHTWYTLTPVFPSFRLWPLDDPRVAQVGGRSEDGSIIAGNTSLGSARWGTTTGNTT